MKKTALWLMALGLLCVSCGKDPENEWGRFYGFTQSDIVGHYEANPDPSLYESLPTEGVQVYSNASLDVGAVGETAVSMHIVIPGKVNKTFSGPLNMSDENRSDITLTNVINTTNKEDIMLTVYHNEGGRVRFHGRVKRYYYKIDTDTHALVLTRSENWGFDVLQQESTTR